MARQASQYLLYFACCDFCEAELPQFSGADWFQGPYLGFQVFDSKEMLYSVVQRHYKAEANTRCIACDAAAWYQHCSGPVQLWRVLL